MPLKDDKLVDDMLKDVSHADVGKTDHPIDDTDANYDEYYDVKTLEFSEKFVILIFSISFHRRIIKTSSQMRTMKILRAITMRLKQLKLMETVRKLTMMTPRTSILIMTPMRRRGERRL